MNNKDISLLFITISTIFILSVFVFFYEQDIHRSTTINQIKQNLNKIKDIDDGAYNDILAEISKYENKINKMFILQRFYNHVELENNVQNIYRMIELKKELFKKIISGGKRRTDLRSFVERNLRKKGVRDEEVVDDVLEALVLHRLADQIRVLVCCIDLVPPTI